MSLRGWALLACNGTPYAQLLWLWVDHILESVVGSFKNFQLKGS